MDTIITTKQTFTSDTVRTTGIGLLHSFLNALINMDPMAAIEFINEVRKSPATVRDDIFFECFEAYILNLNAFNDEKREFVENNLKKMAEVFAEVSPNGEANYTGNPNKLREYAKRIIKLIDDCGTIQKAVYLANISRAFANKDLDLRSFFKLSQCIRMLTEEDLLLLKNTISTGIIDGNNDYIDDFRSQGLIYEVEGGFAYSKRAFLLLKYALSYETVVQIPDKFPDRTKQETATEEQIGEILNIIKGI